MIPVLILLAILVCSCGSVTPALWVDNAEAEVVRDFSWVEYSNKGIHMKFNNNPHSWTNVSFASPLLIAPMDEETLGIYNELVGYTGDAYIAQEDYDIWMDYVDRYVSEYAKDSRVLFTIPGTLVACVDSTARNMAADASSFVFSSPGQYRRCTEADYAKDKVSGLVFRSVDEDNADDEDKLELVVVDRFFPADSQCRVTVIYHKSARFRYYGIGETGRFSVLKDKADYASASYLKDVKQSMFMHYNEVPRYLDKISLSILSSLNERP